MSKGRYLDLGDIKPIGVVVHDDGDEIKKALKLKALREYSQERIRKVKRFQAWKVEKKGRWVLLVGTGMGGTGSSIAVYELKLQEVNAPILKVGTCVSTCQTMEVNTVFVPHWAIADYSINGWDRRAFGTTGSTAAGISKIFLKKGIIRANNSLRASWEDHLQKESLCSPEGEELAVWSSDAFYPIMLRWDLFEELSRGYVIELKTKRPRKIITKISRSKKNNEGMRLVAWDMECAALFSAGNVVNLPVAAALVVTWSSNHWINFGKTGESNRTEEVKTMVHDKERKIIVEAVKYFLDKK